MKRAFKKQQMSGCQPQSSWAQCWKRLEIHSYLGLLLLSSVHNGGAADFSDLPSLAVEGPAADLVSDHVFYEQHPPVEPQRELIEQLDVLQHVVVRVAVRDKEGSTLGAGQKGSGSEHLLACTPSFLCPPTSLPWWRLKKVSRTAVDNSEQTYRGIQSTDNFKEL